jgi:hypothetical protein
MGESLKTTAGVTGDQAAELRVWTARMFLAAGELAAKHVYLDPHDAAPDSMVRAYCSLCLRYGLSCASIDHAPSCAVGRVIDCLNEVPALLLAGATIETPSRSAAAEQPVCAPEQRLRIQYFPESPRKFNPYMNPCPAMRDGAVCELEAGHAGKAHCSGGAVWADDGQVWSDGSRRLA